jgi:IPT/TIG domain-containing protein
MNTTSKTLILILLAAIGVGCGYSKPNSTMPMIAKLNPDTASAGGAQFLLEVDGSGFASHAVINFNGMAEATTVVSSSKLEAMIPASDIMSAARVPVTVTNPGSGGVYGMGSVTSAPMNFTIN